MKKLMLAVTLLSLSIAAPVFACPGHDEAPRTADKAKEPSQETAKTADKAKADKAKADKPADKAKTDKPADKVSQK